MSDLAYLMAETLKNNGFLIVDVSILKVFSELGVWQYFNVFNWSLGAILSPYRHIWLQQNTYYYRQHLYGQTREIIIIPYQWLNVETRECLSPVRKCREQWRGTAAQGLLKCPGRALNFERAFSKTGFMCWTFFFLNFIRADEYFP